MKAPFRYMSLPNVSKFIIRFTFSTIVVSAFFVLIQDFLIFPGLYSSKLFGFTNVPPKDVEVLTTKSADGCQVVIWKVKAKENIQGIHALLFHGNAESQSSFIPMQRWLQSLGITSYAVEYRGYSGRNSGWPSEEGFYLDAEAAFELIEKQEHVDARHMVVLGNSIGTGTAAYVAQKFDAGTLVLLSPYTTLREVASKTPLFGFLAPFIKYHFPTIEFVKQLTNTCVVVAHGKNDATISSRHSEVLKDLYVGSASFELLLGENAGHNDVMQKLRQRIEVAIKECIAQSLLTTSP